MTENLEKRLKELISDVQNADKEMYINRYTWNRATEEDDWKDVIKCTLPENISEAICYGAYWFHNNIWHDVAKETPTKTGEGVLVLCKNKNKPDGIWLCDFIPVWEGKWEPRQNYEAPVKWAYISDILPPK